ncbi:hypothetical protein GcM1_213041b [Golovinomyces cichoracearum]|uniref:Dolichyl-diphosphooligosaccharide--protein glycosyltransferase subunit 4 n=1 Tax=Golovinomyces cichoracearum TaxID=62708 RepID=A0A420IUN4_9PEZI|nr:hypothetical protein GcM1_213041b [Golovinomyces cichoracearum]
MISDNDLYRLAILLGSASVLLIILCHFLEVNAIEDKDNSDVRSVDENIEIKRKKKN